MRGFLGGLGCIVGALALCGAGAWMGNSLHPRAFDVWPIVVQLGLAAAPTLMWRAAAGRRWGLAALPLLLIVTGFGLTFPLAMSVPGRDFLIWRALALPLALYGMAAPTMLLLSSIGRNAPAVRRRARSFVLRQSIRGALGIVAILCGIAIILAYSAVDDRFTLVEQALFVVAIISVVQLAANEIDYGLLTLFTRDESMARTRVEAALEIEGRVDCRVLALDGAMRHSPECCVAWRPFRRPLLIVAADNVDRLGDAELRAVLAHETAHIVMKHVQSRLLLSAALAAATVFLWLLFAAGLRLDASGGVIALAGFVIGRQFAERALVRRQEARADRYAVDTAGAQALISALDQLSGGVPPAQSPSIDMTVWTTHGTPWTRREAIRRYAAQTSANL